MQALEELLTRTSTWRVGEVLLLHPRVQLQDAGGHRRRQSAYASNRAARSRDGTMTLLGFAAPLRAPAGAQL